jgi:DNA-binding GntR family transcriptional regulator
MREARPSRLQAQTARQILALVRRERLPPGYHLTEEALASRFGISRTPIRAALAMLARNGFLTARRHQGYFLARNYEQVDASLDLPASADEAIYMRIARDRVRDRLPQITTETEMMRRYGASRSLVLTVLARMSEEGLVRRGRGREWVFLPYLNSKEEQQSSYEFRLTLEPSGLLLPSLKLDTAALERARRRHLDLIGARAMSCSSAELFEVDAGFHDMLARMSGNNFFISAIEQQNRLRRLIEYTGYRDGSRRREWCREHLAVIDALLAGQRQRAAELLEQHLKNAQRQLMKAD